jgi:hypothetical protein
MKRCLRYWLAASAFALLWPHASTFADGGAVQLVERHGDTQVTIFTSPTPLRAGPIDVSVLVQDAATGQPVPDAKVAITLSRDASPGPLIQAVATREAATNKLLQSALINLPTAGNWNLQVDAGTSTNQIQTTCALVVGRALPKWLTQWTWFTWPVIAVLLFGMHRFLASHRMRRRTP